MEIYLARQAIYDKRSNVIAYELLFRNSMENYFSGNIDEEKATIKLIANCGTIGLGKLTNNKRAFINFPRGVLLKDMISLLEPENIVVEILENVEATENILTYLEELKEKNYILSLDDICNWERCRQFGDLIDIYKIDFMATNKTERELILSEIRNVNPNAELLAEKIENEEEFKEALKNGYSYFQGYYFSKPVIVAENDISVKNLNCFNIMVELMNPEFDMDKIENIVKSDVAISYKLMKFLNSSRFGFLQEITSIRQAIMLLGKNDLKKWLSLIAISEMQNNNNEEITNSSIVKAYFCELVAEEIDKTKASNAFMTGLFSNLDNFMNKDMEDIIGDVPLSEDIKEALLGADNMMGNILKLVRAYENMHVDEVDELCKKLAYDKNLLVQQYIKAVEYLNSFIS
ncbi:MAG: HDOD domain-containing protein [Clostridium sp.]|jgi:EAL and modified HD-GYP domain-containing signal transduction protein|nr:HDOD domain-containing protein [Clostridium sp.]